MMMTTSEILLSPIAFFSWNAPILRDSCTFSLFLLLSSLSLIHFGLSLALITSIKLLSRKLHKLSVARSNGHFLALSFLTFYCHIFDSVSRLLFLEAHSSLDYLDTASSSSSFLLFWLLLSASSIVSKLCLKTHFKKRKWSHFTISAYIISPMPMASISI